MHWVEVVNVFALLREGIKPAKAQCHCQRAEVIGSAGALISGLEINIHTYVHIYTHKYICFIILI